VREICSRINQSYTGEFGCKPLGEAVDEEKRVEEFFNRADGNENNGGVFGGVSDYITGLFGEALDSITGTRTEEPEYTGTYEGGNCCKISGDIDEGVPGCTQ
jgi:hypothetical protein